ncbi:MAG TPA: SPOR domain-containing protein [Thermoanaerobaculia bacterium]|nr:SPOR domain-containing protein [Thermoanaerobaculia bacterium]
MSGEDLTSSRVRRMLPSVSEVLKELTARAPIEPEIAFRAAREVCAEELKRIRDAGGESVPLEDLVQRAFLLATGAGLSEAPPLPSLPFVSPPPPIPEPAAVADTPAPDGSREVEDPFSETTGAMDLRWDRDAREPFSETPVTGAPSGSAPEGEAEPIEESRPVPLLFETEPTPIGSPEVPIPFVIPAEEETAFAEPEPPAAFVAEPDSTEGPGNETLTRLSREAESMDLNSVFPKGPALAAVPFALASDDGEERGPESRAAEAEPAPFEDDEDTVLTIPRGGRSGRKGEEGGPRVGLILGTVVVLLALAGLGYLLVGLWVERSAVPPPVAVVRPRPVTSPAPAPPVSTAVPAETPAPAPTPVAEATPPPAEATAIPTPLARAVPSPARGLAPAPVPVSTAPVPPAQATTPVRQSRDGLIVTKDRVGQAQVFSIHFTSYKDRASAERDLKRIQGLVGREGYVAEVDLGEKGVWQRVMVGTFATAQDAKAVREELVTKGTRDMGWVYRVIGPEGPERR